MDSREVSQGDLFVAISGTETDGHGYLREVVERGAAALVVERDPDFDPGVPTIRVGDARAALGRLAAVWEDHPGEQLRLVGITGTIGKTSVLQIVEEALRTAGREVGAIGSLGVRVAGEEEPTGYTAPDPLLLQEALRRLVEEGSRLAVMEVTSHALDQRRVEGLEYELGVFTNLVPLEHADYHASFREYVEVKSRFFDHLRPGAPLVYLADDPSVRQLVRDRDLQRVPVGVTRTATVRIEDVNMTDEGTTFTLNVRKPLPTLSSHEVPPMRIPVRLSVLGSANVANAAVGASAALCLGAGADSVAATLGAISPSRRRMELVRIGGLTLLDDTVGHPDSLSAVFGVVEHLDFRAAHTVVAMRGKRGAAINRRLAEALAIWMERQPLASLVVTRSVDAADERNIVSDDERAAFVGALEKEGVSFEERDRLNDAVATVMPRTEDGDLVLLLGAQGMDSGLDEVRGWSRRDPSA